MEKFNRKLIFFEILFLSLFLLPLVTDASLCTDSDEDGLTSCDEINIYHTDPNKADTDGDGFKDGLEIQNNYSPLHAEKKKLVEVDSDEDGLIDAWEIKLGTDIKNQDTDGDGEKVEKLIEVNLDIQSLTYYFDGKGVENFKISSGVSSMPTPEGNFEILDKVPSKTYGGSGFNFYYPNTKWNLHFTTDYWRYYIHGAYWHDNFGKPMSHGCVNVAYENMERLYIGISKR